MEQRAIARRAAHLGTFLVVTWAAACGGGADTGEQPSDSAAPSVAGGGTSANCLPASEVSTALGVAVVDFPSGTQAAGGNVMCAYRATDATSGVTVSISTMATADGADEVFSQMNESARLMLGAGAAPETIAVGERGLAYASASKAEAAAVAAGRLHRAEISASGTGADLSGTRDGLVTLLRRRIAQ